MLLLTGHVYVARVRPDSAIKLCRGILPKYIEDIRHLTRLCYSPIHSSSTAASTHETLSMALHPRYEGNMKCCAQFVLHKTVLRRRSKDFYKNLYNWTVSCLLFNLPSALFRLAAALTIDMIAFSNTHLRRACLLGPY